MLKEGGKIHAYKNHLITPNVLLPVGYHSKSSEKDTSWVCRRQLRRRWNVAFSAISFLASLSTSRTDNAEVAHDDQPWDEQCALCSPESLSLAMALSGVLLAASSLHHPVVALSHLLPSVICDAAGKRQRRPTSLVAVGMASSRWLVLKWTWETIRSM